jgi:alkylated DNA repair dioxygenase AlkB
MSDSEQQYAWSGIVMDPLPWTKEVACLRDELSEFLGVDFNGVLINLYRDGDDSVGWHSDDEAVFGDCPTIASVSLGQTREFLLRHKTRSELETVKIALDHGSLLLMSGETQTHWVHALPRRARVKSARINLTFRRLVAAADG